MKCTDSRRRRSSLQKNALGIFTIAFAVIGASCTSAQSPARSTLGANGSDIYSAGSTTLHVDRGNGPVIGVVHGAVVFKLVKAGDEFSEVTHQALPVHLFVKTSELSKIIATSAPSSRPPSPSAITIVGPISVPLRSSAHGPVLFTTHGLALDIDKHGDGYSEVTLRKGVLGDPTSPENAELHGFVDDADLRAAVAGDTWNLAFVVRPKAGSESASQPADTDVLSAIGMSKVGAKPDPLHDADTVYVVSTRGSGIGQENAFAKMPIDPEPYCQAWRVGKNLIPTSSGKSSTNEELILHAEMGLGENLVTLEYGLFLDDRTLRLTGPTISRHAKAEGSYLCLTEYSIVSARPDSWTLVRGAPLEDESMLAYPTNAAVTWYRTLAACEGALADHAHRPVMVGCAK